MVLSTASRSRILAAVFLAAHVVTASAQTPADRHVRLNQIQIIGTHNSYHAGIAPNAAKVWQAKNPEVYQKLDYQHPPLPLCPSNWTMASGRLSSTSSPIHKAGATLILPDLRW
jgi:hypothetical protein